MKLRSLFSWRRPAPTQPAQPTEGIMYVVRHVSWRPGDQVRTQIYRDEAEYLREIAALLPYIKPLYRIRIRLKPTANHGDAHVDRSRQ